MSGYELKIGSSQRVADQPLVELDGPNIFVFNLRLFDDEAAAEKDVFCRELGAQIEVLKGMQSPFMKALYWELVAMESRACEPADENHSEPVFTIFNPIYCGEKIMSQREACEQMNERMSKMDPGFIMQGPPPGHEGLPPPVPMPIYEVPGPDLDPCFDPCSEACLDRIEPEFEHNMGSDHFSIQLGWSPPAVKDQNR